jgi:hypothetical protein
VLLAPIAAFLAGSLLSLLVPICLLIGITAWYWVFVRRVPGPGDGSQSGPAAPASEGARAAPAENDRPASRK